MIKPEKVQHYIETVSIDVLHITYTHVLHVCSDVLYVHIPQSVWCDWENASREWHMYH